jgi:hypothetical protein
MRVSGRDDRNDHDVFGRRTVTLPNDCQLVLELGNLLREEV